MNQEITLDDYNSIGTMETALSEHADEAFFELSPERQKTAEKIFKCLTETDGENREIRRATTVEKLCAIAEADFSEVVSVIEVFRKDGRTFLMPPPDVELNERSLIDISHESLIRKWERLKNWVEEEGQSSRTYRRLAEDALLHKQGKMGFWSDPELKDALEWRENFKPNETWAQLYKETGERQYKASFADAMQYLDESEIKRDEEIAEDTRQQDALKSYAAKLRWAAVALLILFIASLGVAGYALYKRNEAEITNSTLIKTTETLNHQKDALDRTNYEIQEKSEAIKQQSDKLELQQEKLVSSLDENIEATKKAESEKKRAENEKERADKEAKQAKLSEAEKQTALEEQKRLADEAKIAKDDAIKKKEEAEQALARAASTTKREELNRTALTLLEQGELTESLNNFRDLRESYENQNEPMSKEARTDGVWWASHNMGIIFTKLTEFRKAEECFKDALAVLGERQEEDETTQSQNSNQYFQLASYQTRTEVNRSKVTTLRRFAQLYRAQAEYTGNDEEWGKVLLLAIKKYDRLIEIQEKDYDGMEQPDYMVDIYVELADCLSDSPIEGDFDRAKKLYEDAAALYESRGNYVKQVDVLMKWADALKKNGALMEVSDLIEKAIEIQEDEKKMDLSPVNLEIANNYAQLDTVYPIGRDGEDITLPPYGKLSELISKVYYDVNKTDSLDITEVVDLANTYIEAGKCRRAKEVYLYAIDRSEQTSKQGEWLRETFAHLHFYVELAELYQNALGDGENAKIYFDKFVAESKKGKTGDETSYVEASYTRDGGLFERAGDFYFARKDYLQARVFYEYDLQKIEKTNLIGLSLYKAQVLIKIARIDEAQKESDAAEAKYSQAVNLVTSQFGENDIETARILLHQADFYGERKNKEKATEIYYKADATLNTAGKFPREKLALQIYIQRKLGDINSDNTAIAAKYYEEAISSLKKYGEIRTKIGEDCAKQCGIAEEVTRYTKNGLLTEEYWIDKAEILQSWANLKGVENAAALKKDLQKAQKDANNHKTIRCYGDKPE